MADIFYQVRRTDTEAEWGPDMSYFGMLSWIHSRFKSIGGQYQLAQIRPLQEEFGRKRTPWSARLRLGARLQNGPVGIVVAVRSVEGPVRWRVRKIERGLVKREPNIAPYDLSDVSPPVQEAFRYAAGFDAGTKTNGLAFTRPVAGTNVYSQHSKWKALACKGNAGDLTYPLPLPVGNDIARQRKTVWFMLANIAEFQLDMIISERTYYHRDNDWDGRYYSGVPHVSHAHIEGPHQSGEVCW